jgi:N-carbamoyl-L-amino-acid hydrolase
MELRRDPWRAACPVIEGAFDLARSPAPWGRATIGDIEVLPGSRNTVPERIVLSVDLRHPERETLEDLVSRFRSLVARSAQAHDIGSRVEQVWSMPPTSFDARLVQLVEDAATQLGYSTRRMVSGAGHDSLHTAQFAPTAMVFVPCIGGLSHNEAEAARQSDLEAGANVLLHAALEAADE